MDASAVNRRASGRARKQTEIYSSDALTSSAKRKRDDGDDANMGEERGMPEDYVSDEENEDDDEQEPDEEEVRERKRQNRKAARAGPNKPTAQKKAKIHGVSLPVRPAKKRAPKKTKATALEDATAFGGLYAEVFSGNQTTSDVVGQLLRRFDAKEHETLAEIITFVVRSAGCAGEVTEDDVADPDNITNKLEDLRDEYQATNPTEYPLIAKGKAGSTFKNALVDFFDTLFRSMAVKGTLYDNKVLAENIQMWVSTMSSAPNRSFRHTATVVAMTIVTTLCEIAKESLVEAAKDQQQAEKERKKARPNQARIKQMEENGRERTRLYEDIEPMLKDWFDVVFIHRYRDVDPVIRRECVAALGEWILTVPEVYYDGHHLRYLGWVLSDTAASTRGEVIKQLHRLYKGNESTGMKNFTEKFRSRMVEIATTDAENSVRVSGIELLNLLRDKELLEPDDIDKVGQLIFDSDAKIRKTVATFFTEIVRELYAAKLGDVGGLENMEEALPEAGEDYAAPRAEWLLYKSVAETLASYGADDRLPSQIERSQADGRLVLHLGAADSRFSLAADALYDKLHEIRDWQAMAGYVLADHPPSKGKQNGTFAQLVKESAITDEEELIMLEIMYASAKRNLLSLAEQLKQPKTKITARQKDRITDEQAEAARHLTDMIPRLLQKYGDVPSTAAAVLRIESILSLPDLTSLQQDAITYGALLDDVRKQFMSHGTDEVLAPASNAILQAKLYGDLDEMTDEKVTALWDDVITNLAGLLDPATITVRGASQVEELTALSNNLLRIGRLAQVSNCIVPLEHSSILQPHTADGAEFHAPIDYIIGLISRGVPVASTPAPDAHEAALEDQVAVRAADAALFYLRWQLKSIVAAVTTSTSAGLTIDELEPVASRRDAYAEILQQLLEARKPSEEISVALASSLLDLHSNAAILRDVKPKPGMTDDYTALIMDLQPKAQTLIMRVFASCEKNYAKITGKKLEDNDTDQNINDDPMSDPESDDEEEEEDAGQTQESQQRRDNKLRNTLVAEHILCALTAKIIHALFAGVIDVGTVRARLERNKLRLGPNFKEVVAYLDLDGLQKKGGKGKKAKGKERKKGPVVRPDPKSHAIVTEENEEEEIEDEEEDGDEALRRRGLLDEEEVEQREDEEVADGAGREEESVLGD
ncbi:hypothetical protein LTR62_000092 [Meristemomyces frigidus]|uniref:SCD domain-containing protein n=1 Tax=Meristemomyces frigidus TaxID=1508187 RepID=A0AAN7YL06_9PEZI|nr:hypothetical protein LTR62_000092 [Meristemomyces frigidus]